MWQSVQHPAVRIVETAVEITLQRKRITPSRPECSSFWNYNSTAAIHSVRAAYCSLAFCLLYLLSRNRISTSRTYLLRLFGVNVSSAKLNILIYLNIYIPHCFIHPLIYTIFSFIIYLLYIAYIQKNQSPLAFF